MKKGYVIVIEGTDGSGKQTQTTLLYDELVKTYGEEHVHKFSFPNYQSQSSAPTRMYLGGELGSTDMSLDAYQASNLFASDRLCTYFKEIKPLYERGDIIIMDRYTTSNALHQAGKISDTLERKKFLDWLFDYEYDILKLPKPDKVIFLDMPIENALKLRAEREKREGFKSGTKTDIHENNPDHMKRAYNAGKYVSKEYGWDIVKCAKDKDNTYSIEEIHKEISKLVLHGIIAHMEDPIQ